MENRDLEYIVAIAEEGSISAAAERLHMAQSSLSQALSTMETRQQCKLFNRTSRGMRLTAAGEMMLDYAYQTLEAYRQTIKRMQDTEGEIRGTVLLGISSFRGSYLLPPVLKEVEKNYPEIHVRVIEANSMTLEEQLLEGEIDLALLVTPLASTRIHTKLLIEDEICLIASPDHPVLERAKKNTSRKDSEIPYSIDIEDTMDYEYLLCEHNSILGREARRIFMSKGLSPTSYNENLTALMAATMAEAGLGLAFTYYSARRYFKDAVMLSLGEAGTSIQLAMAMPPGKYHSRAAKALRDAFFQVLK